MGAKLWVESNRKKTKKYVLNTRNNLRREEQKTTPRSM